MKHWMVIETKKQYETAMERIGQLMDAKPLKGTSAGKELKLLLYLVEKNEDEHYPIGLPDPVEAIKTRMEDLGLQPKDLIPAIGDKGTVSKVLNRRIPLSLRMIPSLSGLLQLPADVLIREGKLVGD